MYLPRYLGRYLMTCLSRAFRPSAQLTRSRWIIKRAVLNTAGN